MATEQSVSQIVAKLDKSQQAFMDIMDEADERVLYEASGEKEWTLAEVLVHIAEARDFYTTATRDLLATPGTTIGRTIHHERRLQRVQDHGKDSLAQIRQQLITTYDDLAQLFSQMTDDDLQITGEHVAMGTQTLGDFVVRFLIGHDKMHVQQAKALLAGA